MNEKEQLAVVDSNDIYIYSDDHDRVHRNKLKHRAVHVLVEKFGGEVVVQRKAKGTENAGKWSSSASGHVHLGETYTEAAIRELKEELDLEAEDEHDLMEMVRVSPCKENGNEFVRLFLYLMSPEERIRPDPNEVDEVILVSRQDLMKDIEENMDDYSPAFVELFNRLDVLVKERLGQAGVQND